MTRRVRIVAIVAALVLLFSLVFIPRASAAIVCFPWAHAPNKTLVAAFATGEQLCEGEPFRGQGMLMQLQVKKPVRFWPDPWVGVKTHEKYIWKTTFHQDRAIAMVCQTKTLTTWRSVVYGKVRKQDGSVLSGYDVSPGNTIRCGVQLP